MDHACSGTWPAPAMLPRKPTSGYSPLKSHSPGQQQAREALTNEDWTQDAHTPHHLCSQEAHPPGALNPRPPQAPPYSRPGPQYQLRLPLGPSTPVLTQSCLPRTDPDAEAKENLTWQNHFPTHEHDLVPSTLAPAVAASSTDPTKAPSSREQLSAVHKSALLHLIPRRG